MTANVIVTERLILRSATPEDFEPLFECIFSDLEVVKHLSGMPLSRDRASRVFDEAFDLKGTGKKIGVLVHRSSHEVIGYAGLKTCDALGEDDFEIGFVLKRSAWGHGYATEIGRAQLEYGFSTTGKARLLAQVRPANSASARALQKVGMSFAKEYERSELGTWHVYSCSSVA